MRKLLAVAFVSSGLAMAAGWVGTLVDANCKQPGTPTACPVTAETRHFGLVRPGFLGLGHHYYVINQEADEKVLAVLADQQKKTGKIPTGSDVKVWFTGKPDGDKIALTDFALK